MAPDYADGKICYIEIPATDVMRSVEFYRASFGWEIRQHGDGAYAFNDTVGQVSGMWVLGRPPASQPGLVISIMVRDIQETIAKLKANGGAIVKDVGADAPEITAWFRDPAGNVLGLYQERSMGGPVPDVTSK
jgi:predicted enzyme related to lactoylglutathione lyase